jgi:hypothetical protein
MIQRVKVLGIQSDYSHLVSQDTFLTNFFAMPLINALQSAVATGGLCKVSTLLKP